MKLLQPSSEQYKQGGYLLLSGDGLYGPKLFQVKKKSYQFWYCFIAQHYTEKSKRL